MLDGFEKGWSEPTRRSINTTHTVQKTVNERDSSPDYNRRITATLTSFQIEVVAW